MVRITENCPACDAQAKKVVAELGDESRERFLKYSNLKYDGLLTGWLSELEPVVMRCERCGHCWYQDQPSDHQLYLMYSSGNRVHPEIKMTRDPSDRMLREMKKLKSLVIQPEPSFLDYGSGFGRWARAAVQVGFEVHAFEPSQVRGAEEEAPFSLVHDIDALCGKTFDVINLEQVLEHVSDPFEVLNGIHAFCHAKTLIRVTVPNILRCEEGRNIWREWPFNGRRVHIMAPFEHLHGFTPLSLNTLIKRADYKTLPLQMLLRHYPIMVIRNLFRRIYPPIGQTMQLMTSGHLSISED